MFGSAKTAAENWANGVNFDHLRKHLGYFGLQKKDHFIQKSVPSRMDFQHSNQNLLERYFHFLIPLGFYLICHKSKIFMQEIWILKIKWVKNEMQRHGGEVV